jgi:parvulin-like peptidyl-prolyl isomerase
VAKKRRPPPAPLPPLRRRSHRGIDSGPQTAVVAGFIALLLVVVGFLGYGWWDNQYGPPHSKAMRVGDTTLNLDFFSRRAKGYLQDAGMLSSGQSIDETAFQQYYAPLFVSALQLEILLRERAPVDLGLAPTPDQVEEEIASRLGVSRDDAALFQTSYETDRKARDLSDKEYREMIEASLLQDWVGDGFNRAAPTAADQVRFRQILVGAREDADKVVERLNAGEDFATVAMEMSSDTATKDAGGEKGWVAIEEIDPSYAAKVFALEVGQRSEPLEGTGGYLIVEMEEKEAGRPLEQAQRDTIGNRYFGLWLNEQRTLLPTVSYFDTDKLQWVYDHAT